MKNTRPSALSSHLLREAERFLPYPNTVRRTEPALELQKSVDDLMRRLVEWRQTFLPTAKTDLFDTPARGLPASLLDDLYCRDTLKKVPDFVERTRQLSHLTFDGIPDAESLAYLVEAANCYINGLSLAAVALARAAVELSLRRSAAKVVGETEAQAADLARVIDDYCAKRGRLLSREARDRAHQVRRAANDVLHRRPTRPVDALTVLEAARVVILELSRSAGNDPNPSNAAHRTGARVAGSGR